MTSERAKKFGTKVCEAMGLPDYYESEVADLIDRELAELVAAAEDGYAVAKQSLITGDIAARLDRALAGWRTGK